MTLIVHGDSDLNTQETWAGEAELELVGEYLLAPELVPKLVLLYSGFQALVVSK